MRTVTVPVLPPVAVRADGQFGIYLHVPFCASRCGYCDFNTYTPAELAGAAETPAGSTPAGWLAGLGRELELAANLLATAPGGPRRVDTVFVGGGTPSLLGADGLAAALDAVRANFTLAGDAEVTTEANPESTSPQFFAGILDAGYTRVSLGMQSSAPGVLALLDRVHSAGRAPEAAQIGRAHV